MRFRRIKSQPESDVAEQVEPLNEAESEWVAANVAEAKRMLDGRLSPEALDDLWAALIAVRGRANFTVFPTNFIAKRYLGRQTNSISASYDDLVHTAESIG